MPQPPPKLEVQYSINGDPVPLDVDEDFNLGEYDVEIGKEVNFFLRNPSGHMTADITRLGTNDNKSSFKGPAEIAPLQTVECTFIIDPVNGDDVTEEQLKEMGNFSLKGKVGWSVIEEHFKLGR